MSDAVTKSTKYKGNSLDFASFGGIVAEQRALYTITKFCEAVCISRRSYFRLRAEGEGPRVTILGGVHLISHEETSRWLAKHTERNWIDV